MGANEGAIREDCDLQEFFMYGLPKQFITTYVKVDTIAKIAADLYGGKHEKRHRFTTFTPQPSAGNTGTATVVA